MGKYTSTQIPLKIDITKNDTLLFAQVVGQRASMLEPKGGNKFSVAAAGAIFQFEPAKKLSL